LQVLLSLLVLTILLLLPLVHGRVRHHPPEPIGACVRMPWRSRRCSRAEPARPRRHVSLAGAAGAATEESDRFVGAGPKRRVRLASLARLDPRVEESDSTF